MGSEKVHFHFQLVVVKSLAFCMSQLVEQTAASLETMQHSSSSRVPMLTSAQCQAAGHTATFSGSGCCGTSLGPQKRSE